jgi:hypothetical protein
MASLGRPSGFLLCTSHISKVVWTSIGAVGSCRAYIYGGQAERLHNVERGRLPDLRSAVRVENASSVLPSASWNDQIEGCATTNSAMPARVRHICHRFGYIAIAPNSL